MPDQEFGSDGQLHEKSDQENLRDVKSDQAFVEKMDTWKPSSDRPVDPFEASEPGAAAQLRAFEDEHLGPNVGRINGEIERGSGSPFSNLSPAHKNGYAALQRLVHAEAALGHASGQLSQAQSHFDVAAAHAESTAAAISERSESEKGGA